MFYGCVSFLLKACEWGLERVVATLIEYHAEINKQVRYLNYQ